MNERTNGQTNDRKNKILRTKKRLNGQGNVWTNERANEERTQKSEKHQINKWRL